MRTYRTFKFSYETEAYVTAILPIKHRAAFAKFRCGVAPIRLETGRYERLALNQRICPICKTGIEDEKHVILYCPRYEDIRKDLFAKAENVNDQFLRLSDDNKLSFIFSNTEIVKCAAKSCFNILKSRTNWLYS